jgi:hypothetical protein
VVEVAALGHLPDVLDEDPLVEVRGMAQAPAQAREAQRGGQRQDGGERQGAAVQRRSPQ